MMTNSRFLIKTETDKNFLLNLYIKEAVIYSVINIILFKFYPLVRINLNTFGPIVFIFAIMWGFIISSLLHNTSHENIKNKLLNRVVGEFVGAWVMYGYKNFVFIHLLHHRYSDKEHDPVNPKGMSFLTFLSAPMRYMIKTGKDFLQSKHGHHKDFDRIMTKVDIVFHTTLFLRVAMWYLLLQPKLFFLFYVPSLLANIFIFAHINYACHRNLENGDVEVVNLNHNLYYKVANFLTTGGYFHKNHHLNQNLFNPKYLNTQRANDRLFTIKNSSFEEVPNYNLKKKGIYNYLDIGNIWGEGEKKNRPSFVEKLSFYKIN